MGLSLPADGSIAPIVREVDMTPLFSTLDVRVSAAMAFETFADLRTVIVTLVHGETRASLLFGRDDSAPRSFHALLTNPREDEYQYDVEYRFDPASSDGPAEIKAGPYRSRDRALLIHPAQHMRYRRLEVIRGSADLATIPRLEVSLRVQDEPGQPGFAPRTALLDHERRSVLCRWRVPMELPTPRIFARVRWFDTTGTNHEGDEFEVTGEALVASDPPLLLVHVHPMANWTAVDRVVVSISYEDGDYVNTRDVMFTQETAAPVAVKIPILDRQRRVYQWRQMIVRKNGAIDRSEPASADAAVLLVGLMKPSTHEVRVIWVGPPGAALGVRVEFVVTTSSGEQKQSVVLMGQETEKTIALPLDAEGRERYRYEARLLTPTGEELLRAGEDESQMLILTTVA